MGRIRDAWRALVGAQVPELPYLGFYEMRVVSQTGQKFDAQPVDSRVQKVIPGVKNVPIRLGLPGVTVEVAAGALVMVGFKNGNPQLPFLHAFGGGETVTKVVVKATQFYAGDETGAKALVTVDEHNAHLHTGVQTGAGDTGGVKVSAVGTTRLKAV